MHHVLQKLDLYDTSSIITCRGTWYSVAYCKGLACGLHNLVLLQWGKKWTEEGGGGGGGRNATVITNKKHLSHLCNLFSFNMRSMLVEICEF